MGRHLSLTLVLVTHDNVVIVDGKPLVGVDGDAEETGISVDQEQFITLFQVVDDGSFRQISHVSHIFDKLVLWRVLWIQVVLFDLFLVPTIDEYDLKCMKKYQ